MRATGRRRGAKVAPTFKLGLEADSCRDGRRRPSVSCLVVSCRGLVGANGRVRYGQAKYNSQVPLPDRPAAGDGDSSLPNHRQDPKLSRRRGGLARLVSSRAG